MARRWIPYTPHSLAPENNNNMTTITAKSTFNPWPTAIAAYWVLFITGTILLAGYVSGQKMELVRGDYYEDEIRYQDQINRMNHAEKIKDTIRISYVASTKTVLITLPQGQIKTPIRGTIKMYRPSDSTLDREQPFMSNNSGTQSLDVSKCQPGLWKLKVYWTSENVDFYRDQEVVIK